MILSFITKNISESFIKINYYVPSAKHIIGNNIPATFKYDCLVKKYESICVS